jgi:hypothetical protein
MVIEQKFKAGEEPDPTEYLFISMEQRMKDQSKPYDAKTACWIPLVQFKTILLMHTDM